MSTEIDKTIAQINDEVHSGRSVVAAVAPAGPGQTAEAAEKKVDVVTSATLKNNIYLPPMPVMVPPPLPAKKTESE